MGRFLGHYADLTDYALGAFRVEGLTGRDRAGAPKWRVACGQCGDCQIVPHRKVAVLLESKAADNLRCANGGCELSRYQHQIETIDDLRRRERTDAEQSARAAVEAQRLDDTKLAVERAQAIRDIAIQRQYLRYLNHQWAAEQKDENICSRQRWFELTDATRRMVLDIIQKDPAVRIGGL